MSQSHLRDDWTIVYQPTRNPVRKLNESCPDRYTCRKAIHLRKRRKTSVEKRCNLYRRRKDYDVYGWRSPASRSRRSGSELKLGTR